MVPKNKIGESGCADPISEIALDSPISLFGADERT